MPPAVRCRWSSARSPRRGLRTTNRWYTWPGSHLRAARPGRAGQRRAIARRERPPPRRPAAQQRQPRGQDGRLQLVESRVDARLLMVIAIRLAAVSQPADALREPAIVGDDRAAIAKRAEILGGIEAECSSHPDRADGPAAGGRQMRLAAVLDDGEVVARGDALDRGHVGGLAVQVDRQDRARARSDRALATAAGSSVSRPDRCPRRRAARRP